MDNSLSDSSHQNGFNFGQYGGKYMTSFMLYFDQRIYVAGMACAGHASSQLGQRASLPASTVSTLPSHHLLPPLYSPQPSIQS
ncbi:hypothetical protein EON65_15130 [archaeon]|nr:MAG: hypothetical protein EON65_15130 [archaeon]